MDAHILPHPPLLSSRGAGWHGIQLEYHHIPPGEIAEHSYGHSHLLYIETTHRPCDARKWLNGRSQDKCIVNGDVVVIPEHSRYREQWDGEIEFVSLILDSTFVNQVIYESVDPDSVEILPHFPNPDPLIYHMGLTLKSSLETNGLTHSLYAETMATALAVHLLQHYSVRKPVVGDRKGGLSAFKLNDVCDYIDTHLSQELSLTELAALVQMSCHHFARLFKQSTGIPPHQYVLQRRVERAKQLLLKGELTIPDVADEAGFASQSHLSRHLKRQLGVTPNQLRNL